MKCEQCQGTGKVRYYHGDFDTCPTCHGTGARAGSGRITLTQQREFFQLAAVYLGCRLRAMGGDVTGLEPRKGPLHFTLLGMRDYGHEMRLLLEEAKEATQRCPACGLQNSRVCAMLGHAYPITSTP